MIYHDILSIVAILLVGFAIGMVVQSKLLENVVCNFL